MTADKITGPELRVLAYIASRPGNPPSMKEIQAAMGWKAGSRTRAHQVVGSLRAKGMLADEPAYKTKALVSRYAFYAV